MTGCSGCRPSYTSGWLATELDAYMFGGNIASKVTTDAALPIRRGVDVAAELNGRMLVRYIIDAHDPPRTTPTFVSPTAIATDELDAYFALPRPDLLREYAIFLDPLKIDDIQGPRWCSMGQGIEYILPRGYDTAAVLPPGWGVRIR
jgi:hypothetical protein